MTTVTFGSNTPEFIKVEFTGLTAAGAISAPGLQVGDYVMLDLNGHNPANGIFESSVSVADELQQAQNSDLSSQTYRIVLVRWS